MSLVLPQEDPVELDERIRQWFNDLNPRNNVERELVTRAAKLAWALDRAERLRRMQTARGRELRQTLELLIKIRKSEPAQKTGIEGQAAASGSKIKDGGKFATEPGTETAARAATSTVSGDAEAGTSAKVRTGNYDKDRYRSAAALEMVMAERLAEQAFEMCFSDPPEELAPVQGAPLLVELNPPPGLAPVRASGGSESAGTSENDMKKARNEPGSSQTAGIRGFAT
jgi:hypothetical protein